MPSGHSHSNLPHAEGGREVCRIADFEMVAYRTKPVFVDWKGRIEITTPDSKVETHVVNGAGVARGTNEILERYLAEYNQTFIVLALLIYRESLGWICDS
jgi:hypothetical protein